MAKKRTLTTYQREKSLIELIEDAKELKFDKTLIQVYTHQLNQVQDEIKEIKGVQKIKIKSNANRVERGLSE